jgi:hypothetical protein
MIPKSGDRFSEKIMVKQENRIPSRLYRDGILGPDPTGGPRRSNFYEHIPA